jgi:hypothetical protein
LFPFISFLEYFLCQLARESLPNSLKLKTCSSTTFTKPPKAAMATAAQTPVTIIRYMHLKPSSTHHDPEFTALWTEVFAWLKTNSVEAQLWQNLSIPHSLVLISGWPSHNFRSQSFDSSKEKEFGEKLGKFLDSKNYQEIKLDIHSIPLQAPILSIETFSVAAHDTEVFERKAMKAQAHVSETTKAVAAVGGWDIFLEMQQPTTTTTTTTTTTATTAGTAPSAEGGAEKSNLTGDVLASLGEAGKGAVPVTGGGAAPVVGSTGGMPKQRTWVSYLIRIIYDLYCELPIFKFRDNS